jgi:hypothetical protein
MKAGRFGRPLSAPEQVDAVDQDRRFIQTNVGDGERLSDTVCLSDCIGVHQGDLQTVGVSPDSHRLIEIRQTHGNGAPGPACANNEDTNRLAAQEIRRQEMLNAHNDPLYRASRAA